MKFNHWLFAIIIAISIHISLAFAYVFFNSDSKEITIVELSGEKISVNLSSYILASDVVSKPVKPIVAPESVPKAKPKNKQKLLLNLSFQQRFNLLIKAVSLSNK